VTVIGGGGMMGMRIGAEMALLGHTVQLQDRTRIALSRAKGQIQELYKDLVAGGYLSEDEADLAHSRISLTTDMKAAVENADFISEAIVEVMEVKRGVIREASLHCPPTAIISTNTMSLSVSEIAKGCVNPERVMGVRFLYPVLLIADVEITCATETTASAVEQIKSMLMQHGKKPYMKRPGAGNHLVLTQDMVKMQYAAHLQKRQLAEQAAAAAGARPPPVAAAAGAAVATTADVAGGVASAAAASAGAAGADTTCLVCMDQPKNTLLYPCGHVSVCDDCAATLMARGGTCPVCRAKVDRVIRAFIT